MKLESESEPFQDYGNRHGWIPMEAIDDVMGFVSVYPLDSFSVDDLWRASHCVV